MNEYKYNSIKMTPFKWFVLENFPFIEEDFDAITSYQLWCKLKQYFDKVSTKTNETGTQVENLTNAFIVLKNYVDNYFENLDVQDEINNKLDDMAEQGILQDIITEYLKLASLLCYNTVNDMKNATNLTENSFVRTLGFYSINDGGKAIYKIKKIDNQTIINEKNVIAITSTDDLVAELVEKDEVNIKQLGAYGDDTHNDTEILQFAVENYKIIKIPVGTFIFNDTIELNHPVTIIGENRNLSVLKFTDTTKNAFDVFGSYILFNKLKLLLPENYTGIGINISPKISNTVSIVVKECNIMGSNNKGNGIGFINNQYGAMGVIIDDITFNKLLNCIYFNVTENGWTNGIKISNCWEWGCEYGINFDNNTNNINTLEVRNFKGQYTNNVTKALINNVIGNNNLFDSCFIWDGGKTLIISQKAKFTIVRDCYVYDKDKFVDYGFHTIISNPDQRTNYERRYIFCDDFFGADLSSRWKKTIPTEGGEIISKIVSPTTGLRRPALSLTTPAITDKSVIADFDKETIFNGTAPYKMSFDLNIHDLTNLRFYVGCDIGGTRPQGNFLTIDTDIDNNLRFINKTYSDIGETITAITSANILTNKWYHIEISYYKIEGNSFCDLFIDGELIGTLENPQTYNTQPYFYLRSLEDVAKQISIANLKLITYVY